MKLNIKQVVNSQMLHINISNMDFKRPIQSYELINWILHMKYKM